jgi:dTDP-glucose 4,6-dehydratase
MSRVLVLGANSFAGSVFVDASLNAGHEVYGVSRSLEGEDFFLPYKANPRRVNYRFYQCHLLHDMDLLFELIVKFKPEYVIDFSGQGMVAESWQNPHLWYETNVLAKVRLHEFLRLQDSMIKYVRASTPEVYGSTEFSIQEGQPYNPSTPYAVSHASIDMSLMAYYRQYGFPVVLTRFANFYGPGQQLYRIVPKTILLALIGGRLPLHGGGTSIRAFIHARDVASALLLVLEKGRIGETYHFSTTQFLTIKQAVERTLSLVGVEFNAVVDFASERPGKDMAYLMNVSKAREELDWKPEFDFDAGVTQTIEWVRKNIDKMSKLPWDYQHKN